MRLLILATQVLIVAQLLRRLHAIISCCLPLVAHVSVRCALVLAMLFVVLAQSSLWSVDLFSLLEVNLPFHSKIFLDGIVRHLAIGEGYGHWHVREYLSL